MASKSLSSHSSTRVCLCSPTNHPGSFRCSLHRNSDKVSSKSAATPHVNRQRERQSKAAMMLMMSNVSSSLSKSSLIKAFLMQIIRPSSTHTDLQRRRNFHPKPSRFSSLNTSANGVTVS
ncbi:hypothetical protein CXB51_012596 [Gossypium anomalum]|uniref:Serine-rich protein-like protein n=1 Tax=Gossypium anomalum TaxID=47600 RepID=A0A8J5YQZ2_9ROSI|nr:hypothetical protein CXB51_012596 [Gossypium anomalum]